MTKDKTTANPRASRKEQLSPKQAAFVQEYLIDLNATQAAIRAGYSKRSAYSISHDLLAMPKVEAAIAEARTERSARTHISQDQVLKHWWELATADTRDLVEYRRFACRYCWGISFNFQWRTRREFQEHTQEALDKEKTPPTDEGGYGYTQKKAANPDCPECDGEGDSRMVMKDTRELTGGAALLYAGTQIGKDGLKVITEDRAAARVNVAKHMGMLDPKLTLKGDAENPIQLLLRQMQGSALKPTADPEDDE